MGFYDRDPGGCGEVSLEHLIGCEQSCCDKDGVKLVLHCFLPFCSGHVAKQGHHQKYSSIRVRYGPPSDSLVFHSQCSSNHQTLRHRLHGQYPLGYTRTATESSFFTFLRNVDQPVDTSCTLQSSLLSTHPPFSANHSRFLSSSVARR